MNNLAINKTIPPLIPALGPDLLLAVNSQENNPSQDLKDYEGERLKCQMKKWMLHVVQAVSIVSIFILAFAPLPSGVLTQYHALFMNGSLGVFVLGAALKRRVAGELECYDSNIDALTFKLTGKSVLRKLSTVERIDRYASLHLQALCNWIIEKCTINNPLHGIKGTTFVAPSYNRAKFTDLAAYTEPKTDYQMVQVAARDGIKVGPQFETTPFMQGVCFGCCLTFAHTYFKTHSIETAAAHFTEGAPIEAVELQGKYRNLCRVELGGDPWVYDRDTFSTQKTKLRDQAMEHVAGFTIVDDKRGLSYDTALETVSSLKEGVHSLSIPVFSPLLGLQIGRHALLVVKEKDTCTLFDPNFGTIRAQGNGNEVMRKLLRHYNINLVKDTSEIAIETIEPFTNSTQHFNRDVTVDKRWENSLVAREQYGDL